MPAPARMSNAPLRTPGVYPCRPNRPWKKHRIPPTLETATLNKLRRGLWHYYEACPALHTPRLFVMDVKDKMVRQTLRKPAATAYLWLLDGKGQQDEKVVSLLDEICPGPRTVGNIHEQIVQYENYKNRARLRTLMTIILNIFRQKCEFYIQPGPSLSAVSNNPLI